MENDYKKKEDVIKNPDEDQVFGDNDQIARINVEERNKSIPEDAEDTAKRTRDILGEAERTRDKLNKAKNQVRDYNSDAREIPL